MAKQDGARCSCCGGPVFARGMCKNAYQRDYNAKNGEKMRAYHRQYHASGNGGVVMHFRVTAAEHAELDAWAHRENISKSELIRRALACYKGKGRAAVGTHTRPLGNPANASVPDASYRRQTPGRG